MAQPFDDIRPSRIAKGALKDAMTPLNWNFTGDLQHNGSDVVTDADIIVSIPDGSLTNAKLANVATQTFKARTTAGVGAPEDVTATQATAMLDEMTGDFGAGGLPGLVPSQAAGDAAAGKFLKADGSWSVPAGGGGGGITELTGDVTAGPGAGAQAATIAVAAVSNAKLATVGNNTIKGRTAGGVGVVQDLSPAAVTAILNAVVGDGGAGGTKGLVPAPAAGDAAAGKFLKADGTFAVPPGAGGAPAGADTQVQFNDGGVFGGDAGFVYNKNTDTATLGVLSVGAVTDTGLTASRAIVTDGAKLLTSSATTATELGYVNGVTSAIQGQLNAKQPLDATLTALAALDNTAGYLSQTGADTFARRTLVAGSNKISITNTTGLGNPSFDVSPTNILAAPTTTDLLGEGAVNKYYTDARVQANTLNQMTAPTADLSMNTHKITNVVDPVGAQDACTKSYADAIASGLLLKQAVRLTTTADLPASTYNNGAAGVGATLTGDAVGILTIDGEDVVLNDRLLIKDQATAFENGIYECTTEGTAGVAFVLTRTTDNDTSAEILSSFCFTREGTANGADGFVNTNSAAINIGVDDINWTQFSQAGTITAGDGMVQAGNAFNVVGTAGRIVVAADSVDIGANVATSSNNLGFFSATTAAQFQGLFAAGEREGTVKPVFSNSPTIDSPTLNNVTFTGQTDELVIQGYLRASDVVDPLSFLKIQGYNEAAFDWTSFVTIFSGNPVATCDLADSVTKAGGYIYRAGGTEVLVADGGTGVSAITLNSIPIGQAGAAIIDTGASASANSVLTTVTAGSVPTWKVLDRSLVLSGAGGWGSLVVGSAATGPSALQMGTNKQTFYPLHFGETEAQVTAEWTGIMPESYDETQPLSVQFIWTALTAGLTDVIWSIQAFGYNDGNDLDQAFPAAVTVTDTNQGSYKNQISDAALGLNILTPGGAPGPNRTMQFRVFRNSSAVGDTLVGIAELLGVKIFYKART